MISILMFGESGARPAALVGAVASLTDEPLFVLEVNGVVDKRPQLHVLVSVLVLFGRGVLLSFLLLLAAFEREHGIDGGVLHNSKLLESAFGLESLSGEHQSHFLAFEAELLLDLGSQAADALGGAGVEQKGLSIEGFDEDLHRFFYGYRCCLKDLS